MNYLSNIRRQFEENTQYLLRCVQEGKSLKTQAPIVTMVNLKCIGRALFKQNDRTSLKDRSLMNQQLSAVGRSSEISGLRYDDLQWMDSYLLARMSHIKTSTQHSLSVFGSALHLEIDPFSLTRMPAGCESVRRFQLDFQPNLRDHLKRGENSVLH
uniref:Uncharacterized protein n=1 Tax=Globisporangium ultimum (strain ATCC 200006 / CBS 805.95 / DAOM BR144) TaxID=431595 RepID=K3WM47_GLOUD